jgi:hypothetical protein
MKAITIGLDIAESLFQVHGLMLPAKWLSTAS